MKTPDLPEEKPSAPNKRNSITADSLQARLQAGEIVGALDYPEADRPLFWAAIAIDATMGAMIALAAAHRLAKLLDLLRTGAS